MRIRRYAAMRVRPLALAACGLALCLCVAAAGGAARAVRAWSAEEKRPVYSVETDKMEVALGINCAWDNADIPELLEIFARYRIQATFFIVGDWCDRYPESVKAIYDAGHEIGSHSDTHADMTTLDDAGILREIRDSCAKLRVVTGERVKLFRVPSGAYNSRVIELIEQEGLYPIQWDCDLIDIKTINMIKRSQRVFSTLFLCDHR